MKEGEIMRIYACLLGEWIDITETATVADCQNPVTYFQENLRYEDGARNAKCFEYDYIHIQYQGKDYRINPAFIQIVKE
jgi:hypothetical protein